MSHDFLASALIFLLATVVAVPLAKRYKLGAVLGYLAAGVAIGPDGLKLIESPDTVLAFSEIGVVLLLFVLGLELSPKRLKAMRQLVLAVGPAQVIATTAVIGAWAFLPGVTAALIVGFSVAISSTAFAVQLLAERQEQHTDYGRGAFGVSLLQDLVAVPLVALLPLLALASTDTAALSASGAFVALGKVLLAIALVIFVGRVALRPFLRLVAEVDTVEVFAAASLLVVLGTGWLMQEVGLSLGLGAFLAGVLLAESEYQHEIESHIAPYRGLLLGLFFIAVGMTLDLDLIAAQPFVVAGGLLAFLTLKALVMLAVGHAFGYRDRSLVLLAVLLACGGEFA
ncbi:MAG: monovalent cation:proton antiporter-2 (CPA2) family protein, partial [Xanthomonadales bacterium]|nr:monovalent cation:proton antiporter-2 (CPA2) family protein [Xanthomonadales bacterium]